MVDALARLDGLQHFIWSTLPAAPAVPHLHSKNMVDRYIAECHPKLLARTTFLRVAWYAENLAWHEFFKPQKYVGANRNPMRKWTLRTGMRPLLTIVASRAVATKTSSFNLVHQPPRYPWLATSGRIPVPLSKLF